VALIRPQYHLSYVVVVMGCLAVAHRLSADLLATLSTFYLTFNVLLYGGIYTLNAISDVKLDRLHPTKCGRPLASGVVRVRHALVFGCVLIGSGLAASYWLFPAPVADLCLLALLLNFVYSGALRRVPYVDITLNAATHPLRFALGNLLAGGQIRWTLLILVFLVAAGVATLRRRLELLNGGTVARPALQHYSSARLLALEVLFGLTIAVLWSMDGSTADMYYVVTGLGYAILVLIPELHGPSQQRWHRVWSI
jgi:hypothetical protein